MQLQKIVKGRKKRIGRGGGSGKGFHTVGRGVKGQKARRSVHILFEGFKMKKSLLRRLPMQRGKSKFKARAKRPVIINLEALNLLADNSEVTVETLIKAGIIEAKDGREYGVKVLGSGEVVRKLNINVPISKSAAAKVTKSGGKVTYKDA